MAGDSVSVGNEAKNSRYQCKASLNFAGFSFRLFRILVAGMIMSRQVSQVGLQKTQDVRTIASDQNTSSTRLSSHKFRQTSFWRQAPDWESRRPLEFRSPAFENSALFCGTGCGSRRRCRSHWHRHSGACRSRIRRDCCKRCLRNCVYRECEKYSTTESAPPRFEKLKLMTRKVSSVRLCSCSSSVCAKSYPMDTL